MTRRETRRINPPHEREDEARELADLSFRDFVRAAGRKIIHEAVGRIKEQRGGGGLIYDGVVRYQQPIEVFDQVLKKQIKARIKVRVTVEVEPW
jgi:hypothetical protein